MKNNERKRSPMQLWKRTFFLVGLAIFVLGVFSTNAQTQTVTGLVSDADGEPLIGVSVVIKGTNKGTITNLDGKFTIDAKNGDAVVFKYLGYKDKELKVSGATLNVTMDNDAHNLDEVVVVGYGTQKRGDVAGAIASVSEKTIEQKQPVNLIDALQGEAPGLQVTTVSGAPGAGSSIQIRGASSFSTEGSNPLFVVDGIIMDNIDMINPNDIKSVDILKDASSSAIYGARGANGVILVTTKQGGEGKPRINVRYLNSYGFLSNKIPQMNREERDIFDNTVQSQRAESQPFLYFRSANDSVNMQGRTSNDYQDLISQTAVRNDLGVSITGGTKNLGIYTSFGYLGDKGIVLTSYLDRYTARSKVDYQATDFLKFTTNISGGYEKKNSISEGNTFYNAIRRPTQSIVWFPDGTLVPAYQSNPSGKRNPLIELYSRDNETAKYTGNLYQNAEIKFLKYFSLVGAATVNLYYSTQHTYNGPEIQTSATEAANGTDSGTDVTKFYTDVLLESYLSYAQTFAGRHNVSAVLGVSREDDNITIREIRNNTYLIKNDEMQVPQSVLKSSLTELEGTGTAIGSYFGRLSYDYDSKYIFRGNFRRDGSSRFGKENRWGFFPSPSVAWRISDEFFMDWARDILTDAKIRVSWGVNGNDRVGVLDKLTLYGVSTNPYSYGGVPGVYPLSRLGNDYLKWEETQQTDIGLDVTLLDGKVVFAGDYYIKKTEDLFNDDRLPTELGYLEQRTNFGTVENRGIELSVTAMPVRTKDFSWSTTINWTRNKNKIISIAGDPYAYENNYWVEPGMATGNFYGYKNQGVYAYDVSNAYTTDFKERLIPVFQRDNNGNVVITKSGGPQLIGYQYQNGKDYGWKADGSGNEVKQLLSKDGTPFKGGDNIWLDYDANGQINDEDRHVLDNAQPDWYGGWSNVVKYKDFSLNFSIYASWGGTIYNSLLYDLSKFGDNTSNADPRSVVQGWKYQGEITDWNIPGSNIRNYAENNRSLNSFYLEDASFIRLQTVRLTYQPKAKIAEKLFMQGVQLYVYGNNLLTWTNYRGYDPEISTGGVLNPRTDSQKYPKKREIGFGLSITL